MKQIKLPAPGAPYSAHVFNRQPEHKHHFLQNKRLLNSFALLRSLLFGDDYIHRKTIPSQAM